MKTQSSEYRARDSGTKNIVPKDVIQSSTMWLAIPAAQKIQRSGSRARRKTKRARKARASAKTGIATKE